MTWSLTELRDAVRQRDGRESADALQRAADAIVARQIYARLHFQDARALIESIVPSTASLPRAFEIVFGARPIGEETFESIRRQIEARLVACVESLNVLADMLAQVVYRALAFAERPTELVPRSVSYGAILKALRTDARYAELANAFASLGAGADFAYLRDLVNTAKHRSIIGTPYSFDLEDHKRPKHGVRFAAFEYEGRSHKARWAEPFVEAEYSRQSLLIVQIGNLLNQIVLPAEPEAPGG